MEYKEEQKLNLWWLYLVFGVQSFIIATIYFTRTEKEDAHILWMIPFIMGISWLINRIRLRLKINESGITYKVCGLHLKERNINWNDLDKVEIRKYDALGEYGGWGIKSRLWFKFRDIGYIFNNENQGLQLYLKNKKKILFSTGRPDELRFFLSGLKSVYHVNSITG